MRAGKYSHWSSLLGIAILLGSLLAACGGGGGDDSAPPPAGSSLWISSPSNTGTYQTDSERVSLSGGSFVPDGANCTGIVGTIPAGYQVVWFNAANGTSGNASFYLGCLLQVNVIWSAPQIPLELGSNSITVTATDSNGTTAHDTIVVTRLADTTAPTVIATAPIAGATGIPINTTMIVTFSEAMDSATITPATVTLKDNLNNPITAGVVYDSFSSSARLTPSGALTFNRTYTATVTTGVQDAAGNALAAPYVFTFTTAANLDITPPLVQSVSPVGGSTCASTAGTVTASFDEDLDPATVNGSTFSLTGPASSAVSGVVAYLNRTVSFTPDTALAPASSYTAALTTGITDLAGNPLASPFQWTFTTISTQGIGAWVPTSTSSTTSVPFARYGHVAVWTGSEMIIAGGLAWDSNASSFQYTDQFGRYNPVTEAWSVASGAPAAQYQKAVWTGSRMLVWGGYASGSAVTGGAQYDPDTNAWAAMATASQPSARFEHTAVWTGSEMIVWGGRSGYGGTVYDNGARYNPVTNTWQAISTMGAPSARFGHTAIWTGTEMIVWGGQSATGALLADGARYNPVFNTWTPISNTGAPTERYGHVAIWTGDKMIVWGDVYGSTNTGGLYDPVADSWVATEAQCAPSGRWKAPAVWTGTRMIIWGGATVSSYFADGYAFNPVSNAWELITPTNAPAARAEHTAVWADGKMIVWGGYDGTVLNSGGLLAP